MAVAERLRGTLHLPADKSIAHRALLLNAMGEGEATVTMRLPGGDVRSTASALGQLGAVSQLSDGAAEPGDEAFGVVPGGPGYVDLGDPRGWQGGERDGAEHLRGGHLQGVGARLNRDAALDGHGGVAICGGD